MKRLILFLGLSFLMSGVSVSAQEKIGLQVGDMAPGFSAVTHQGADMRLQDYLQKGPVVLIFYRGGWCYYCNLQLQAIQTDIETFQSYGAQVIALSVDTIDNAAKTVEEKLLDFTVVSHPEADILEKYGLTFQVPEDLAQMYKEKYKIDLQAASGRDDRMIAIPATYVIHPEGRIVYAFADKNYKVRAPLEDVFKALNQITE